MQSDTRILLLEDNHADAELAMREVRKTLNGVTFEQVQTRERFLDALARFNPDLILADYNLPSFDGLAALFIVREKAPETPFILVTGTLNEEIAVECMKAGAWDYILKERVLRLGPAVLAALEKRRERSELQRAEKELLHRHHLMQDIIRHAPNAIAVFDRELRFIYVSERFLSDYGVSDEDIQGRYHYEVFPDIPEKWREVHQRALQGEILSAEDDRFERKDGSVEYNSWQCRPWYDVHGEIGGIIIYSEVVTKRKEAELALLASRDAAEAGVKAKNEFLANMSHELRTPLNGIMGMLQLMQMSALDAEHMDFVDMAMKSANRLTNLLSDILNLCSVDFGTIKLDDKEFDPTDTFSALSDLFLIMSRDKGVRLVCTIDPRLPASLLGDEARLRQVLFNLLGNAFKFTEHGEVELDVRLQSPSSAHGLNLALTVSDTGIGIPEDKMRSIFEPFYQVEGAYTRRFQGAGLGLAVVQKLVRQMGGDISVQSALGRGTSVRVTLPFGIPEGSDVSFAGGSADGEECRKSMRILLAEDDRLNQVTISRMLEKFGHETVLAVNGRQALDLLAQQDFDCILMDIQMPLMTGLEATMVIRSDASFAAHNDIPIIAITAYALAGDRRRFLDAGVNAYLAKPVNMKDLEKMLNEVVRKN